MLTTKFKKLNVADGSFPVIKPITLEAISLAFKILSERFSTQYTLHFVIFGLPLYF